MKKLLFILLLLPGIALAQEAKKEDVWQPLRFFAGQWTGTGSGKSGTSDVKAQFEFLMGGKYMRVKHRAVFEPQENNPEGEVHEDEGFISYDGARKKFVFRQFHVEGFVNQYVLDSIAPDGKTLVFVTESVENAPPGLQARWTLKKAGDDECHTTFDLAFPGQDGFSCFSENQMKRMK